MNNQNPYNTTPVQGGKFCYRCGTPLDANGICPQCAQQPNYQQQNIPQQKFPEPNYQQQNIPQQTLPQQNIYQQGYPQSAPKAPSGPNVFTYALEYIKAFFSADPSTALDKAANEQHHVWSILGAGSVILIALGIFGILANCVDMLMEAISGIPFAGYAMSSYTSEIEDAKVGMFFEPLVIIILFFFASAGLDTLFFTLQKKKVSYIQNMNILSVAMLPLAVCGAAAFLCSFIYIPLALILLFAGIFFKYIMLYDGLRMAAAFEKNPTWFAFGLIFANMISFIVIVYIFVQIVS